MTAHDRRDGLHGRPMTSTLHKIWSAGDEFWGLAVIRPRAVFQSCATQCGALIIQDLGGLSVDS